MFYLKKFFHHLKNGSLRRVIRRTLYVKLNLKKKPFNEKKYLIGLGKKTLGYEMDLDNPKSFNEKLNWYKLNYYNNKMLKAVDKFMAKQYVAEKGLSNILVPTIKIYDSVNEISLVDLPDSFVAKNTQDSGGVFVCKDKNSISIESIKKKLENKNGFIVKNGRTWSLEPVYRCDNNKVIIEELIKTKDGRTPWDYIFFCFNGKPKFLFVGSDRDTNVCFDFFDIDFNWIDVRQGHPNSKKKIEKPQNFDEMIKICEILSEDFPQVRVDLYNVDGKIYFGELTFYHFAGLEPFKPKKWDRIFGDYWDISSLKGKKFIN